MTSPLMVVMLEQPQQTDFPAAAFISFPQDLHLTLIGSIQIPIILYVTIIYHSFICLHTIIVLDAMHLNAFSLFNKKMIEVN